LRFVYSTSSPLHRYLYWDATCHWQLTNYLFQEREAGTTTDVVTKQLSAVEAKVKDWSKIVIAYEPIWYSFSFRTLSPIID
jgi:hypothetical protein